MQSLALLYSNEKAMKVSDTGNKVRIYLNEEVVTGESGKFKLVKADTAKAKELKAIDLETGKAAEVTGTGGEELNIGSDPNKRYRVFYVLEQDTKDRAIEITISAETFPGTYKLVGDTYARNRNTGKDEYFQFIIERAKMSSEVTLTMEAKRKALGLLKLCELLEAVA